MEDCSDIVSSLLGSYETKTSLRKSWKKYTRTLQLKFVILEREGRGDGENRDGGGGSKKVLCCAQHLHARFHIHTHTQGCK